MNPFRPTRPRVHREGLPRPRRRVDGGQQWLTSLVLAITTACLVLLGGHLTSASADEPEAVGVQDTDIEQDTEPEDGPDKEDDDLARREDARSLAGQMHDWIAAYGSQRTGAPRPGFATTIFRPPIA